MSLLQKLRAQIKPSLSNLLKNFSFLSFEEKNLVQPNTEIQALFPHTYGKPLLEAKQSSSSLKRQKHRVGVIFSGGPAPGGHNAVWGLFEGLKMASPSSELIGFLNGPSGLLQQKTVVITEENLAAYRNQGGFDLLGSGRTKIETAEDLALSLKTAKNLGLTGLVIIGGDDSNTNAALLDEYFVQQAAAISVIGLPKTIDGDLKNSYVATSFGFDTATI
jgi:pyrophosphate--fructose-6-phosphate 1-phosphotransferase